MTTEFCRHCGADIPAGAASCPACGAPVAAPDITMHAPAATTPAESAPPALGQALAQPPSATPASPMSQYVPYPSAQPPATAPGVYAPYPGYGHYPQTSGYYAPPALPQQQLYQPYVYPHSYYPQYYAPPRPRRAPGETYALVISWIVTVASAVAVLGGLLITALGSLGVLSGFGNDLSFFGSIIGYAIGPIVGGGFGLWYGIMGILRRRSPRFDLPRAWFILVLALVALGGGFAVWQFNLSSGRAPGTAAGMLPLASLAGILPALTILAFATQRLRNPSTRRHVWMSLMYGMTLATLFAVILELVLAVIVALALGLTAQEAQAVLGQPDLTNLTPKVTLALVLVLSVVAPLVEEGVKPLGALLAIRRLRTPAEAFLVGLAGGIGFDILETIGYIGHGQVDWISIAIERIGAGLLHGVGAGMTALGWYYLINGSGVHLRWLKGIGCGVYAVAQHGIFNALWLLGKILPPPVTAWLNQPMFLGSLPLQHVDLIYLGIYALLAGMLVFMTSRLVHAKGMAERRPPAPTPYGPVGPYAPYPYYVPQGAPANNWPAAVGYTAPATSAQSMGGAR